MFSSVIFVFFLAISRKTIIATKERNTCTMESKQQSNVNNGDFVDRILTTTRTFHNSATSTRKFVKDRMGNEKPFNEDKILSRMMELKKFVENEVGIRLDIEISNILRQFQKSFSNGCSTYEIDEYLAKTCAYGIKVNKDPDYDRFASQLMVDNISRQLKKAYNVNSFGDYIRLAQSNVNFNTGEVSPLLSDELVAVYNENSERIEEALKRTNKFNYLFSYPAMCTLVKGQYFLGIFKDRNNRFPIEIPSYMFMRVALGLSSNNIDMALKAYNMLICQMMIPSSPTIFSAGTPHQQLASCFLLGVKDDLANQFEILSKCGQISKHAGGIGIFVQDVRSEGSYISSSNGVSKGILDLVKMYESAASYVNQSGKRAGSFAIYTELYHADFEVFIKLKDSKQPEASRAHNLNYGLWTCDLFWTRLKRAILAKRNGRQTNEVWSFMNPQVCPGMSDVYGEEFNELYESYERKGMYVKQLPILKVWAKIKYSMAQNGQPYIMNKDECNRKSNQKNQGVIKCSNLCTEIIQYSSGDQTATCNLFSANIAKMVKYEGNKLVFDFDMLMETVAICTFLANRVIDANEYPCDDAREANFKHRPIALGLQGLAIAFQLLGLDPESEEALQLNREISEMIYFAALEKSCQMAEEEGEAYSSFQGSPLSQGKFHFEMWDHEVVLSEKLSLPWESLRSRVIRSGTKNSLLIGYMPTATASVILDNTPSFEFPKHIFYTQTTRNGEFLRWPRVLINELKKANMWDDDMYDSLFYTKFSIQHIERIPLSIRKVFKTNYDLNNGKAFLDMNRDRAVFVDQGISLNVDFYDSPEQKDINVQMDSYYMACHDRGMKNFSYYTNVIKSKESLNVSVDKKITTTKNNPQESIVTSHEENQEEENQESLLDILKRTSHVPTSKTDELQPVRKNILDIDVDDTCAFGLDMHEVTNILTIQQGNTVDTSAECVGCT